MNDNEPLDLSTVFSAGVEALGDVSLGKASCDKWKRTGH